MVTQLRSGRIALVIGQAIIGLAGVALVAFYPPANGPTALVALDGRDAARLIGPALTHGAIPLGRGPFANILLVKSQRPGLASAMLRDGVLAVAAPRSWCGAVA